MCIRVRVRVRACVRGNVNQKVCDRTGVGGLVGHREHSIVSSSSKCPSRLPLRYLVGQITLCVLSLSLTQRRGETYEHTHTHTSTPPPPPPKKKKKKKILRTGSLMGSREGVVIHFFFGADWT